MYGERRGRAMGECMGSGEGEQWVEMGEETGKLEKEIESEGVGKIKQRGGTSGRHNKVVKSS